MGFEPMTNCLQGNRSTTELYIHFFLSPVGFEPTAFRLSAGRSTPELWTLYVKIGTIGFEPMTLSL
jgi:hypothetical protein